MPPPSKEATSWPQPVTTSQAGGPQPYHIVSGFLFCLWFFSRDTGNPTVLLDAMCSSKWISAVQAQWSVCSHPCHPGVSDFPPRTGVMFCALLCATCGHVAAQNRFYKAVCAVFYGRFKGFSRVILLIHQFCLRDPC